MTIEDIPVCVKMYRDLYEQADFLETSEAKSIRSLKIALRRGDSYMEVMHDAEDRITAWIWGSGIDLPHIQARTANQMDYGSSLVGISAVRAVLELHRGFVAWASDRGFRYVISGSLYFDERCTFSRILGTDGWKVRGYLAVKELEESV